MAGNESGGSNPKPLTDASEYLTALSKRWDSAIDRLRTYVEDE